MHHAGLLDLLDELTSGTLIMPRGHLLNPSPEAVAWADSEAEMVLVEAWPVLGVPGASAETTLVSCAPLVHSMPLSCGVCSEGASADLVYNTSSVHKHIFCRQHRKTGSAVLILSKTINALPETHGVSPS